MSFHHVHFIFVRIQRTLPALKISKNPAAAGLFYGKPALFLKKQLTSPGAIRYTTKLRVFAFFIPLSGCRRTTQTSAASSAGKRPAIPQEAETVYFSDKKEAERK